MSLIFSSAPLFCYPCSKFHYLLCPANLGFILLFFAYLIKGIVSPAPDNSQGLSPDMHHWVDNNHRLEWTRLPGTFHPKLAVQVSPRLQFHREPCQPPGFGGCHGRADLASHRPQPQVLSVIWKQEDLLKFAEGTAHHRALLTTTILCLWVLPSHLPGLGPWCLCPWALKNIHPSDLTKAKPVLPSSHQFPNTEPRTSRSSHSRIWDQLRRRPEIRGWEGAHVLGVHSRPKRRGSA